MKLYCIKILIITLLTFGAANYRCFAEDMIGGRNFDVIYTGLNKGYAEEVLKNSEDSYSVIS